MTSGRRLFPRWGIFVIDIGLSLGALAIAYLLRFNFNVPAYEIDLLIPVLPMFIVIRLVTFWSAGLHRLMVRHTNTDDARRIFLTVFAGSLLFGLANVIRANFIDDLFFLPRAVIIIDFMATAIAMIVVRIGFKLLYLRSRGSGKAQVNVIIHGAGEAGLITKRTLEREGSLRYNIIAFTDNDPRKAGKSLEGAAIHSSAKLPSLLNGNIDQVIIAIARPDPEDRRKVVEACLAARVRVLTIPPVKDWINGQLSAGQIAEVRIEDLLGRAVIHLERTQLQARFAGKRIMVTGAAGSIGSELVRQLSALDGTHLVLVDVAESGLYDLQMELSATRTSNSLQVVIGDVRDRQRMARIFQQYRPQIVFHAAAYKHVPLMEAQPSEAVRTNILGTRILAELACENGVEHFVLISTDKAVNPTSVMGASKRIAEMLVNSLKHGCSTAFVTTRFGNVLGSSGSVIPLFRRQIAAGGPVTVTDPQVTRFFMTIPEACRLVLEAAAIGQGGEIYEFDMGEPVRIADMAEKMIRLSGLEPGQDIEIVYTGLRPGEKLFEELLATTENTLPTHHPRILIGKVREEASAEVISKINGLIGALEDGIEEDLVKRMKQLIPEYQNHNSSYSNFDVPSANA
ncbi:MAG: polysaccharide biosynthesis protein [Bacteroidota bacterium]|nr:polysaccharide biosynthesis protein [Bacteroidota bacterium]